MSQLLWDRFFTVCQAHVLFWERQAAGGDEQAGSAREVSATASPPRGAIFRHHAQLLAYSFFFQSSQVRRSLLAAHLGLVRKLAAVVVARESSVGDLLLAQCMALAEFLLRTVHDGEQSLALTARLRRNLAGVPDVPAAAAADAGGNASTPAARGQRCRYLCVFEADEDAGIPAMHERPGVARASSRALCSERETWLAVLRAAAASPSEDASYLFFSAWRLLGTLPPQQLSREHQESPGEAFARFSPGVEGMAQIRSCLLGLQAGGGEWGLLSSSFATALSAVRDGLPDWFGLAPMEFADAMVADTAAQKEVLAGQLRIHGLLEVFAVYVRAGVATATKQEGGLTVAQATTTEGDNDNSSSRPLVDLSLGLIQLAEECVRYYERTVEGALTALHAVGASRASSGEGARTGDDGTGGVQAAGGDDVGLAVPISMLVHCHTLSSSFSRLSLLGCDQYLVGGLHTELNSPKDETVLDTLPSWDNKACTQSTSRGSQSSSKMSAPFAEPDEAAPKERSRARAALLRRKWEVIVNGAAWSAVASSKTVGRSSGADPVSAQASTDEAGTGPSAQNLDAVVDSAAKVCVSARSMLNSVLLGLFALTDALASAGTASPSSRQGAASRQEAAAAAAGEAWSAVAIRAAALWGELSMMPWCKWFEPLCSRAFDKLVLQSDPKGVASFSSEAERKREKARKALELWKLVAGSWEVRRADKLLRLALERGEGSPVCATAALTEGLDQLSALLAMPHTAGNVVSYYVGDKASEESVASPGGSMVAQAIAAVAPGSGLSKAEAEGSGAMETELAGTPASHANLVVVHGDVSTLLKLLLERSSEFSGCLPKTLLVLRKALEVEANATKKQPRPLTDAVARAFNGWPEGVVEELVAGAVGSRPDDCRGTQDAVAVLSLAVGYPDVEQRNNLQKRLFTSLMATAASWVGRRAKLGGKDGAGSGLGVDLASLSLWLASRHGMYTELVVSVMGVARGLVHNLEGRPRSGDEMQVEETAVAGEEVGEDETAGSLARCLALVATVLGPAAGTVAEESDTDSEDGSSVSSDLAEWIDDTGKVRRRKPSTRTDLASDETAVEAANTAPGAQQEPPLVCTFVSNHRQFVNQHWYHCYTCNLVNDKGCCRLCARVCHRGHDVSYARLSCFFCDCGSSADEGEAASPSLENSPASVSSSGGDASSPAATAAAAAAAAASSPSTTKCSCLKPRTRRELDLLLSPTATTRSRTTAGGLASNAGRTHERPGRGLSGGRSRTQVATSPTKVVVAAAARADGWRSSPAEMASMRAALLGAGGKAGIIEELHAAYSILLSKFNAMHAGGGAGDQVGGGSRGEGSTGRNTSGNGTASGAGAARVRPWDSLCDAMESAVNAAPSEFQPPAAAAYLRCRPLDSNARVPVAYPILAPARLLRNGSLDVRLPADGVRARQDRAAMTLHGVVRRNLAATSCGKIAVAESQKVLIIDPVGALALRYASAAMVGGGGGGGGGGSGAATGARGSATSTPASGSQGGSRSPSSGACNPADMPVDRSHLCVLSSMAVGFDVVGVAFNPANERHLVVWGLRQCCVVVLNSRGVALRRVKVRARAYCFCTISL